MKFTKKEIKQLRECPPKEVSWIFKDNEYCSGSARYVKSRKEYKFMYKHDMSYDWWGVESLIMAYQNAPLDELNKVEIKAFKIAMKKDIYFEQMNEIINEKR